MPNPLYSAGRNLMLLQIKLYTFNRNDVLVIEDDLTIEVNWDKVGDDQVLQSQLAPYAGQKLNAPEKEAPRPEYLQRRRALVAAME